ncbi:MAG: hypothetical protein QOH33_923, partial [Paraburkholderia sp.]|nr:hypothetical protein [Paraburkholderia sp.]
MTPSNAALSPHGKAPRDADSVSAWSLIKPYWVSEEWKIAWGLL